MQESGRRSLWRGSWICLGRLYSGLFSLLLLAFFSLHLCRYAIPTDGGHGDSPKDTKVPNGLRYHLIDIYVDELEKLNPEMKTPLPVAMLLSPFKELMLASPIKLVRTKSKELLCDGRLVDWGYDKALEAAKSWRKEGAEGEDGDATKRWAVKGRSGVVSMVRCCVV